MPTRAPSHTSHPRTVITVTDVRRRGAGYFLQRVAIRGESFEVHRAGRAVAVLVPLDRFQALELAERDLNELEARRRGVD